MTDIKKSNRIQYLDALRGFTMILVVLNHVAAEFFGIQYESPGHIHYYFSEFRMPLFFFVSGFVLYKKDFIWNIRNSLKFLNKKLFVQVISPFIFLCTYVYVRDLSLFNSITGRGKAGFWFTFTLFTYFIIYAIIQYIFDKLRINKLKFIIPIYLLIGIFFYFNGVTIALSKLNVPDAVIGTLGTANLLFFIYFLAGTLTRKYFTHIETCLDKSYLLLLCIVIFFTLNIFLDFTSISKFEMKVYKFILALSGITIVFSVFRKNKHLFESCKGGEVLKFIGRRTLDIYLIHIFFLYRSFSEQFPLFSDNKYPLIELSCSLLITALVILASLVVSYILRLSPVLAHYLFGAKKQTTIQ